MSLKKTTLVSALQLRENELSNYRRDRITSFILANLITKVSKQCSPRSQTTFPFFSTTNENGKSVLASCQPNLLFMGQLAIRHACNHKNIASSAYCDVEFVLAL